MSESQSQSQVSVVLPDGSELAVEAGASVEDVAFAIGPGLGEDCIAGRIDGELSAKEDPVHDGAEIEIITEGSDDYLQVLRHSAAHALAQAVERQYDVDLAIGPPTDDGFYYDFDGLDIDAEDLEAIEAEMADIVEADYDIVREEVSIEEARERLADEPYKLELLEELAEENDTVTFYRQGDWEDLCAGPHVASTGEIGAVALTEIAAAYWRGDEQNPMQTRVYGTAFRSESDLEDYLEQKREAERRDHRRIGRQLDLFSVPEHSPGCVHFHPNGMRIRRELEDYVRDHNDDLGYEEVWTPELNKVDLWKTSGHYEHFCEQGEMFNWKQGGVHRHDQEDHSGADDEGDEYGLKPMNCANHVYLYDKERRSYRDLPVRFSEFGTVYRNEQSGELSGLLRVRGFTQDDGHAFVRRDQIEGEVQSILERIESILNDVGMSVTFKLETEPDDSFGDDAVWQQAEGALRDALDSAGVDYTVAEGEGAFYGPKVGADAEDAIGREWTIGTVQLDFVQPERFDLTYVGEDNEEHRPVMIHRALLGSFERFMGVLTEHFAGQFPLWLAPEQVRVLPISDDNVDYAEEIADQLSEFRVSIADGDSTLQRRIRAGHDDQVPYMLILGDNEAEDGTISVRDRKERQEQDVDPQEFLDFLRTERDQKRTAVTFLA